VAVLAVAAGVVLESGGVLGRKQAARQREKALATAHTQAVESVHRTFARLTQRLEQEFADVRRTVLAEGLSTPLAEATRQREEEDLCRKALALIAEFDELTPPVPHQPERLLQQAVQAGEDGVAGRVDGMWLGARTVTDTSAARPSGPPARPDVHAAMTAFQKEFPEPVDTGTAERWISEVHATLHDEDLVRELRRLAWRDTPTIAFCGDYDSGKSSLIKRLFCGALDIAISPLPETYVVAGYPHPAGWTAVDTPGFQADAAGPTRETSFEIATASLVVMVLTPGLVTCDSTELDRVLHGDAVLPGRIRHCLFVINRSDSCGTDPEYDPAGFSDRLSHKLEQLRHTIPGLRHGVCVSAAPFGVLQERPWDGLHEFGAGLAAMLDRLRADHTETVVLTGGQILLGERLRELRSEESKLVTQVRAADAAHRNAARLTAEAAALLREREEELRLRVGRIIDDIVTEALATRSTQRCNALVHRLERLGEDSTFLGLVREWGTQTADRVQGFRALCEHRVAIELEITVPSKDFPALADLADAKALARGQSGMASVGADLSGKAGGIVARLDRIASVGGRMGTFVRVAGPALTVVGALFSIHLLVEELRAGKQSEQNRREAMRKLHAHGEAWVSEVLRADAPLTALSTLVDELSRHTDDRATSLAHLRMRAREVRGQVEHHDTLIDRAAGLLEAT
jgi:hypothetical protein